MKFIIFRSSDWFYKGNSPLTNCKEEYYEGKKIYTIDIDSMEQLVELAHRKEIIITGKAGLRPVYRDVELPGVEVYDDHRE